MSSLMARLSAAAIIATFIVAVAALVITSSPGLSGTQVKAEFVDAYPLLPGMYVRIDGAIAGTVGDVELNDRGRAIVSMQLNEGTTPPHADATAAIRQQDITGDSYVDLGPGQDAAPLGAHVIPPKRTIVEPRFDDLLNSFDAPVRKGLEFTLVELGKALESRGDDLNDAVLRLRPGVHAANQALAELRSQNHALSNLVVNAEDVTGQAASRSADLGRLIDSLATLNGTVAAHGTQLDAALETLPEATARGRVTLSKLRAVAEAGIPLARTVQKAAPDLAKTAILFGPFMRDTRATLDKIGPTLGLVRQVLKDSIPTLRAGPKRVLTAPFDLAGSVGSLLNLLLGDHQLAKALFGADGYGHGPRSLNDVGLGSVGVEAGNQPGYEAQDPARDFLRAVAVPTCETLGVKIAPGCLDLALANLRAPARAPATTKGRRHAANASGNNAGGRDAGGGASEGTGGKDGLGLGDTLDHVTQGLGLGHLGGELGNGVKGVGGNLGLGGKGTGSGGSGGKGNLNQVQGLLDYIFG